MKLLFDENLSHELPVMLQDTYPDSTHVSQIGLTSASDTQIWAYAKEYNFVIVSKDSDFANRCLRDRDAPRVIWLRLGNGSTKRISDVMRVRYSLVCSFLQSNEKYLVLNDRPFIVKR